MKINYLEYIKDKKSDKIKSLSSTTNFDTLLTEGIYSLDQFSKLNFENCVVSTGWATDYSIKIKYGRLFVEKIGTNLKNGNATYRQTIFAYTESFNILGANKTFFREYNGFVTTDWDVWTSHSCDGVNSEEIFDILYPIGSIYLSVQNRKPIFGTWEKIKDRFLLSDGDRFYAGDTGGEIAHTLTEAEMPSHYHTTTVDKDLVALWRPNADGNSNWELGGNNMLTGSSINTDSKGENYAHNNMPPYLVVYVWKRIS